MNKKILPTMVCFALITVAGSVIALDSLPVEWSGTGTVSVTSAGPTVPSIAVNDTAFWGFVNEWATLGSCPVHQ